MFHLGMIEKNLILQVDYKCMMIHLKIKINFIQEVIQEIQIYLNSN
jgi:hypothetical protein